MLEPKPKSNCPVCESPNTNGYLGVEYGDPESFEPMECDDCGATWHQLWVRGGTEAQQFLTRPSQQLYTSAFFQGVLLTDNASR
jgi:hypothetical protein